MTTPSPLRISVLQHHPVEGPGRLEQWAGRHGIELLHHDVRGGSMPTGDHPIVVLGGPDSLLHPPAWMVEEIAWLRSALAAGRPILGICLGAQLLAAAAGGRVARMDAPESGWTPVHFADGSTIDALSWHEDAVVDTGGARIDATSRASIQCFRLAPACIGLQFHPEWDETMVHRLHACFPECPLPLQADDDRQSRVEAWFDGFLHDWRATWPSPVGDP